MEKNNSSFHLFSLTPEQELERRRFLFDKLEPGYVVCVNSIYFLVMEFPQNDEVKVMLFNEYMRRDILDTIKNSKLCHFEKYGMKIAFNDAEGIKILIPRTEPPPHIL